MTKRLDPLFVKLGCIAVITLLLLAPATGVLTGVSYALLYLLVLSEEYARLFGALALFAVLAAIMIGTRKFDWYALGQSRLRHP